MTLGRSNKQKKSSNRPEQVIANHRTKRQKSAQVITFPVKPLSPHGIQFIFKEYNFQAFVATNAGRYGTASPLTKYQKTDGVNADGSDKKVDLKTTYTLELPFPTALTDATGLTLSGIERDLVTAAVGDSLSSAFAKTQGEGKDTKKAAIDAGKQLTEKLQAGGQSLAKTYQEGAKEGGGFAGGAAALGNQVMQTLNIGVESAKLLGAYLARNFLGDISKTIAMDSGFAINPQETLSFEGVDLKTYTFDWDLYPSNAQDSERIKQIVRNIKQRILPSMSGGGFEKQLGEFLGKQGVNAPEAIGRLFLSYPDTVIINLIGVDESHWPMFKPAMCTGIDIDYAGGGDMVIAEGGRPASINLSMSFSELVIHTADDYSDDHFVQPEVKEEKPKQSQGPKA